LPQVLDWRDQQANALITKSKLASSAAQREEYLSQAAIVGWGGVDAPRAQADYFASIGRFDKAWRALQSWPLTPNYSQLGDYALRAQEYNAAQRFYARAIAQKSTTEAYVGLAAALLNKGDYKNGCANATKATKLNLDSSAAQQIAVACIVLQPKQTSLQPGNYPLLQSPQLQTERGVGQFLIANRVYSEGEKRLLAAPKKSASDWLLLAQLASSRGDYTRAAERGEEGIKLDRSNADLNALLAQTYRTLGESKADLYEARFKALPSVKAN
jgi:tetratricopeptide (TPR) repeat protein